MVAELVEPGSGEETLRDEVGAARRRIRAVYESVVARGSIAALGS